MLRNYFKIALKVFQRRKFFTFVSLSGITFTITVLIVAAAFVNSLMYPARPGSKFDRTLFVEHIECQKDDSQIYTPPSYHFLDRYVRTMKTPELVSILKRPDKTSVYKDDQRIDLQLMYTDASFWDILEFHFVEGGPFDQKAVDNADHVAVITERASRELFGSEKVAGRYVETTDGNFRVLGVIPKEDIPTMLASAEIYVPITIDQSSMNSRAIHGSHVAFLLARDKDQFDAIKGEFNRMLDQARKDYAGEWDVINSRVGTQTEALVTYVFGADSDSAILAAVALVVGFMLLFMLFPAINLINLNITRIMERASEIGVRKAFGASSLILVGQFLTENIILTLAGGLVAWVLSFTALWIVTGSDLVPYGEFRPSPAFFFECLLICLVFGVVSGVYPAYRMSRMQPVDALRGVES